MGLEENKKALIVPALDGGLVTYRPAHLIEMNQCPDVQNFDPSEYSSLKKRKGYIKFTSAAKVSPTGTFVSGLLGATLTSGTTYVLASEGTALHNIAAGTWPAAISGTTITVDTPVRMVAFNDIFVICNQGGGPWKWTGSGAVASLGGSPPANARIVMVHRSRTWMAVNDSVLYFSALSNPEDWTTADNAGSITINKNDGMNINGMASAGDFAVISKLAPSGKEGKLYAVYGSSPFDFTVRKIADIGAVQHEAMIAYDNFVAVAADRGIYGIQGRSPFKLSKSIQPDYDAITNKGTIAAGRKGTTIRFAYPATGTQNNREFILDVERGVWGRNTGKTIRVYGNHPDGRLLSGTSGTSIIVWEEDNGTNDDTAAINFYAETMDLSFGVPPAARRMNSLHLHAKNTGSYTITVEHYIDGTAQSWNKTMNVSTEGPILKLVPFNKTGKFHRFRFTNNTADQDISIYTATLFSQDFEPGSK